MNVRWSSLAFVSAALAATAMAEDLTVTSKSIVDVRGGTHGTPVTESLYVSDHFLRVAQAQGGWIVDAASGRITMIDLKQKTYYETSYSELASYFEEEVLPKSGLMRGILSKQFANLTIEKQQDRRTIAGYECEHYVARFGSGMYQVWATTAITPPATYYDVMEKVNGTASFMGSPMTLIYAHMRKLGATPLEIDTTMEKLRLVDVFSAVSSVMTKVMYQGVASVTVPELKWTETTEPVTEGLEVSRDPIPPATFEIPAGLTRIESPYAAKRR